MNDKVLRIENLTVTNAAGDRPVLQNISFDISRGRITGIVGESGSGKSVTALTLMRLLPPGLKVTEGVIRFNRQGTDVNILSLTGDEVNTLRGKHISMVFQEPMTSLNPSMKCGLQVDEVLRMHTGMPGPERRQKIIGLFNQVKLPRVDEIFNAYPHQLSGGQRQRIMIAIALAAGPEILIADEPTTALDVTVQKKIVELLRELQEKTGISVIFISHDLRLIGEIASEIVVMRNGLIVERNDKHALLHNPAQPYTRGLLACQPPLDHKPFRLLTVQDFEKNAEEKTAPPTERRQETPGRAAGDDIILSVRNLSVHYKQSSGLFASSHKVVKAVDNVTLEARKGETLGLVGESGCGKTTLGLTILQLIRHQHGDIDYRGKSIAGLRGKDLKTFRQRVQVVFQDPYSSLNPRMTVGSMIKEVLKVHFPAMSKKERDHRLNDLLIKCGLSGEAVERYPHEFSGGQRQRIGIARALATNPEFLILDESVSALDVSVQAQVLNLLNDLKRDFGLTYLFISHDLAVVKYMSDRVVVMKDGHIEEIGDPDQIYRNPLSEYTRHLINAVPGKG